MWDSVTNVSWKIVYTALALVIFWSVTWPSRYGCMPTRSLILNEFLRIPETLWTSNLLMNCKDLAPILPCLKRQCFWDDITSETTQSRASLTNQARTLHAFGQQLTVRAWAVFVLVWFVPSQLFVMFLQHRSVAAFLSLAAWRTFKQPSSTCLRKRRGSTRSACSAWSKNWFNGMSGLVLYGSWSMLLKWFFALSNCYYYFNYETEPECLGGYMSLAKAKVESSLYSKSVPVVRVKPFLTVISCFCNVEWTLVMCYIVDKVWVESRRMHWLQAYVASLHARARGPKQVYVDELQGFPDGLWRKLNGASATIESAVRCWRNFNWLGCCLCSRPLDTPHVPGHKCIQNDLPVLFEISCRLGWRSKTLRWLM